MAAANESETAWRGVRPIIEGEARLRKLPPDRLTVDQLRTLAAQDTVDFMSRQAALVARMARNYSDMFDATRASTREVRRVDVEADSFLSGLMLGFSVGSESAYEQECWASSLGRESWQGRRAGAYQAVADVRFKGLTRAIDWYEEASKRRSEVSLRGRARILAERKGKALRTVYERLLWLERLSRRSVTELMRELRIGDPVTGLLVSEILKETVHKR